MPVRGRAGHFRCDAPRICHHNPARPANRHLASPPGDHPGDPCPAPEHRHVPPGGAVPRARERPTSSLSTELKGNPALAACGEAPQPGRDARHPAAGHGDAASPAPRAGDQHTPPSRHVRVVIPDDSLVTGLRMTLGRQAGRVTHEGVEGLQRRLPVFRTGDAQCGHQRLHPWWRRQAGYLMRPAESLVAGPVWVNCLRERSFRGVVDRMAELSWSHY